MLYFRTEIVDGNVKVVEVVNETDRGSEKPGTYMYRGDIKSFEQAQALAAQCNELTDSKLCGKTYLAADAGSHVHPRYDVVLAPRVGEPISYAFNGDYYPDGYITKIGGTNCSRVYTDTGSVYNRRRKSGSWIKRGGTWSMVSGHISELNPSF